MAMTPEYSAVPNTGIASVTTANTNRDGTGTIETVLTAGASGSRIEKISIKATATVSAGMIRFYVHDGTTSQIIAEIAVTATTASSTVPSFEHTMTQDTVDYLPLTLPTGYSLRASTQLSESFKVIAQGGDF